MDGTYTIDLFLTPAHTQNKRHKCAAKENKELEESSEKWQQMHSNVIMLKEIQEHQYK